MSDGTEPIVLQVELGIAPQAAFDAFVSGFGDWWPVRTHSLSRAADTRCAFEPRAGGHIEETAPDGTLHRWGSVERLVPGRSVRFTWHPGREAESAQWVEVTFAAGRKGKGCVATLVHGGWEQLGEIAPILRREYVAGWQAVFGKLFAAFADKAG